MMKTEMPLNFMFLTSQGVINPKLHSKMRKRSYLLGKGECL
jgi:hypothetical protein